MAKAPKKVVVYEDGTEVRPTHRIKLDEGMTTVKEITEGFKILVQFDDAKIRPMFRELNPEDIGGRIVTQEAPKPALGLMPRSIWIASRIEEIRGAIDRYEKNKQSIPRAWLSELAALQSSTFTPHDIPQEDINEFTQKVQYQPAYSVEQLNQMVDDVLPFLIGLGEVDVEVIDGQLVNVAGMEEAILTAKFDEDKKNFAYLCAFLLNNARNILLRK